MFIDKSIEFQNTIYNIQLNLRRAVTVIDGNSGAGKTLVSKMLKMELRNVLYYDYSDITSLSQNIEIIDEEPVFRCKNMIIIIDNFEYLYLNIKDLVTAINCDKNNNTFIVIARGTNTTLDVNMDSIGRFKFNRESNSFYIEYDFDEIRYDDENLVDKP